MSLIQVVDSIQSPETTHSPIPEPIMKAQAVLGYNYANSWLTYGPYCKARPDLASKGWVVSTTLSCLGHSRCYDIEPGGGKNQNIGAFMQNADRSHGLPWLYTFASNGSALLTAAKEFGYQQGRDFYYYSSHVGRGKHLCGTGGCRYPKADGTQYDFAGSVDYGVVNDYMLSAAKPAPPPSQYDMFPTDLPDSLPNKGNERLTVEQTDGALEHAQRYHDYLKGQLRPALKIFRDRIWRVAHMEPPTFTKPRPAPYWNDNYLGVRWQAINHRMEAIDKL